MKIYTKGGDQGKTSLFSGERVPKSDPRVNAYGHVDELSAFLGLLITNLPEGHPELVEEIRNIQIVLSHIGSWLATTPDSPAVDMLTEIPSDAASALESSIDRMEIDLATLKGFILPGGSPAEATAHVARTVCRRGERYVVLAADEFEEGKGAEEFAKAVIYLNRLSDYLFVFARYCNHLTGISDITWKP